MTDAEHQVAQQHAVDELARAGIVLTPGERARVEIADFGLGRFGDVGLALLTYVNTERVCAKELVLLPGQVCPEHRHPAVGDEPGKEETFRCRRGRVHLFVPEPTGTPTSSVPADAPAYAHEVALTATHEVILEAGEQYTIVPDTLHWFHGGREGAVVSEFSTRSRDALDVFSDPRVDRRAVDGS